MSKDAISVDELYEYGRVAGRLVRYIHFVHARKFLINWYHRIRTVLWSVMPRSARPMDALFLRPAHSTSVEYIYVDFDKLPGQRKSRMLQQSCGIH